MIDEETLAQMNGKYVMPPDAGPAWRKACEYGFDMSLVEDNLRLTMEERLHRHQLAVDTILALLSEEENASR
jgi:hypothetical protein